LVTTTVVAACLTPSYDWRADTISALAAPHQPFALVVRAAIALYGALVIAAVHDDHDVIALLVRIHGACTIVVAVAPKPSAMSDVHVAAAVVAGAAIIASMLVARSPRVAAATFLTVIAFELAWGTALYGVIERALLTIDVVWLWQLLHAEEVRVERLAAVVHLGADAGAELVEPVGDAARDGG